MKFIITLFLCVSSISMNAQFQEDSSKQKNSLFHPVLKKKMREFETDRPDATESPYTLDAGHFQLETDLLKIERSKAEGVKTITNNYNTANLKLGITHSLDIQIVAGTYFTSKILDGNTTNKTSGFGGLTVRAKQNIWGNDGGKTALAILPFINIPTSSSEKFSGGIVFPIAIALRNDWNLGAQVETEVVNDETGEDSHFNYLASATLSHFLFKKVDFFAEGVIARDNEIKEYEYFLDTGLIYELGKNINIDCGVYYGLKRSSSKTYFVGFSFRI